MKSILHLKDDTEYQIPLREAGEGDRVEVGTTQSQDDSTVNKETEEISQEEVNNEKEVNNENDPALDNLEDETQTQEPSNAENSSNDTTTENVPQVDSAKAALDEMKKLASQEGVIHPSLFISNFSKILGLMERAMQLQVKESGSATEESGSVTKEKASKTAEPTEPPAEGK